MLKSKENLISYIAEVCDTIVLDGNKCKKLYKYANEKYDIPKGMLSDIVTKRMQMEQVSNFVLFILLESLSNIFKDDAKQVQGVDKFFTMQEAKAFRQAKYEVDKIKFPIIFKMIQVTDDQWVGNIDVKMLMKLRQAQLINYNVNAQRTMQRVIQGGKESYKISLNHKAVKEIQSSLEKNEFIPNTITLNIPAETENDFYYDADKCELVINSIEHLDVSDGFHRFIAMSQENDINAAFNYQMELRIVNWNEDKAKQFIYQEDKKTFMKKVDRESMNMNKAANIVATRLNEDVRCNIKGLISRNEGVIPFAEFAELIDYFYFKGTAKEKERTVTIQAVKELSNNFNVLTEYYTELLEHKMEWKTLLVAMFCFNYFKDKDVDPDTMCKVIMQVSNIDMSGNKKLNNKVPRKALMDEIKKYVEDVL